jgi:hypothetical protein
MSRLTKNFFASAIFFVLLTSCNNDQANIELVRQFINSSNDQLESFVTEDFQLNMIGEREFPKGENSVSILSGTYETRDQTGTTYKDLKIEATSNDQVTVTYQLKSWLIDCIHIGSSFEDIYSVENGKISYLITKATSINSDSLSMAEQKNFHNWIDQRNLTDSINEQENWLKYLKIYCDSKRVIE